MAAREPGTLAGPHENIVRGARRVPFERPPCPGGTDARKEKTKLVSEWERQRAEGVRATKADAR